MHEGSSSKEGMITTSEGDYVKKNVLDAVVIGPNTTSRFTLPEHYASAPGIIPLNLVLLGRIHAGSICIFLTVSAYMRLRLLPPSIRTRVR